MDMTMCTNQLCNMKNTCIRYTGEAHSFAQSYFADPASDCEGNEYEYYESDGGE